MTSLIVHPGGRLKPTKQQQRLWIDGLNFGQKQRLRFLEARLLWDGEFNRKDVCDQFGVTPNHFTRELSAYKAHFPENLKYDEVSRIYRPTEHFKPAFATGDVEEYFALLRAYSQHPSDSIMVELGSKVPCGALPFPDTHIDRDILRGILLAIHRKIGGEISYQSFSQALPKIRTIWPHALLWTGDQWHLRAFDDRRQMHINLAITRIATLKYTDKSRPKEALVDAGWENVERVEVVPNPRLSLDQQQVVAREYGMIRVADGWVWGVSLRSCLVPYFLYRFRLDEDRSTETNHGYPVQRIILRDPSIRDRYAFGRH